MPICVCGCVCAPVSLTLPAVSLFIETAASSVISGVDVGQPFYSSSFLMQSHFAPTITALPLRMVSWKRWRSRSALPPQTYLCCPLSFQHSFYSSMSRKSGRGVRVMQHQKNKQFSLFILKWEPTKCGCRCSSHVFPPGIKMHLLWLLGSNLAPQFYMQIGMDGI